MKLEKELKYDVFFSYATEDLDNVKNLRDRLGVFGVTSFIADENLKKGKDNWENEIFSQMELCNFFILYGSRSARSSEWVTKEIKYFYENVYSKDNDRRMFVLLAKKNSDEIIPEKVIGFLRPNNEEELINYVVKGILNRYKEDKNEIETNLQEREIELGQQLMLANSKVKDAFQHYGQKRFWEPFSKNKTLHIFTCGRSAPSNSGDGGRRGARTNIDKWDYQTVLCITHFFAENYPNTRVIIEDPLEKILRSGPPAHKIAQLMRELEGKDCVIVGSPDVSDLAEIVLAQLHSIESYQSDRRKRKGFAIIKSEMTVPSSAYWTKLDGEKEGVAWIEKKQIFEAKHEKGIGETFGILIVSDNPFSKIKNKIIILSGFTGVATFGVSKLLTDRNHLDEFFKIDQQSNTIENNFEALIKVPYKYDPLTESGDSREVNNKELISLEAFEEI